MSTNLIVQFCDQIIALMPKILAGVVIYLVFWILSKIVRMVVLRASQRTKIDANLASLLASTVHIIILVFGGVTALGTMGINIGALITGLGLSGFALSFAMKDGLSNILAGISILLYHPFRVGDYISVTGLEGRVIAIDLRYTILMTDEQKALIPNANIFTTPILILSKKGI